MMAGEITTPPAFVQLIRESASVVVKVLDNIGDDSTIIFAFSIASYMSVVENVGTPAMSSMY